MKSKQINLFAGTIIVLAFTACKPSVSDSSSGPVDDYDGSCWSRDRLG
jgi:hypothetical protein